jgi:filamentous hemagglutinin family protein
MAVGIAFPASAQVAPDGSVGTTVSAVGNQYTINNGTQVGGNLFHSFSQFSIPTGGAARFNNALTVQTIFARVTGGSVSNIDGLLQTNGSASLFLLNPAGILFGSNASLNLGGSLVATTANSIKFADGNEFGATQTTGNPLLTVSVPIGLQMGQSPGAIAVQGNGQVLSKPTSFSPTIRNPGSTALQVQPGRTLALVGGNLNLNGASLVAEQGRIELGSLSGAGWVSLTPIAQGYQLGYDREQPFGEIQLAQRSVLDVSGVNAGSVQVQGRQIQLTDGSLILAQNLGPLAGGTILLQASERINLIGTIPDSLTSSGVQSQSLGSGASGTIQITTPQLTLQDGAGVNALTYGVGDSGKIEVAATAITLSGYSPTNPNLVTSLNTSTYGSGNAGSVLVNSESLLLSNAASLSSATFGFGSSGQVTIHTTTATVIGGANSIGLYSAIASTTVGTGSAKTLTLNTTRLRILDGGSVGATAFFTGQGGNVTVNATEAIEISGRGTNNVSSINSSTLYLPPLVQQSFGLPNILTANAGSVSVTTPHLIVTDGGAVSVTNQGSGNGGALAIAANLIKLDRQGSIQAQTASGEGGDIQIQAQSGLILRHGSFISATAGGTGNGGNITINAPIIAGFENSDIVANAVKGRGGNINITTQGIIGLKYRSQLTPESDITASSQFGVNGSVQVNNIGVDPNSGLVELPANVVDTSQQIATGCAGSQGSSFIATGRGGVPQNPTQQVRGDRTWDDLRDLSAYRKVGKTVAQKPAAVPVLIQASTWQRNADGTVELIADQAPAIPATLATCSGDTANTIGSAP